MNRAYVTRHTFTMLAATCVKPNKKIAMLSVYEQIFAIDLRALLNHYEATNLLLLKKMFHGDVDDLDIEKRKSSRNYAFKVGPPKYHKDGGCDFLKSDFSNYLVPPEIKVLGDEKVREFQEFCEAHKKEFQDKEPDLFWNRVSIRFKVHLQPQPVNYLNSGIQDLKLMSLDELKKHIADKITSAISMIEDEKGGGIVKSHRFAPKIKKKTETIKNERDRDKLLRFAEIKNNIISAITEFYKKDVDADGYILPVALLEAAGLERCKACWRV